MPKPIDVSPQKVLHELITIAKDGDKPLAAARIKRFLSDLKDLRREGRYRPPPKVEEDDLREKLQRAIRGATDGMTAAVLQHALDELNGEN
jgi:hypothetical protein